jgi:hypothetical protein
MLKIIHYLLVQLQVTSIHNLLTCEKPTVQLSVQKPFIGGLGADLKEKKGPFHFLKGPYCLLNLMLG